jgi:hypothetical protein
MAKLTQLEELDIAIKLTARDAEQGVTSSQLAVEFYDANREMIEPFIRQWVVSKLANLIGKHRARAKREANPQLTFESMLGFKHLPTRVEVVPGETVARADSKIQPWRRLARSLTRMPNPAREEALRVVAIMTPYTEKERNITWGEVLKREAERLGLPRIGNQ